MVHVAKCGGDAVQAIEDQTLSTPRRISPPHENQPYVSPIPRVPSRA